MKHLYVHTWKEFIAPVFLGKSKSSSPDDFCWFRRHL